MRNPDPNTVIAELQLSAREERILRRIMSPEPPEHKKSFLLRPLRGLKGAIIAALSLLGLGLGIVFLWPVVAPRLTWFGDSEIKDDLLFLAMFLTIHLLGRRLSLVEQLVKKLYSAMGQDRAGEFGGSGI